MLTPLINIIFAWLLDEALDVMMDTMKHSPWTSLDPLIINERQKYVYLSTGGTRPVLLNFRACAVALLSAAFVWPPKESKVERQENAVMREREELAGDEEDPEEPEEGVGVVAAATTAAATTTAAAAAAAAEEENSAETKKEIKKDGDVLYHDPLFVPPDWVILIVEMMFWSSFVGFPFLFTLLHGGTYNFGTYPEGFLVSIFLVALVACPLYAAMHLLVYLWPRAARLDAFLTGRNVAEFAWPPYFTDLKTIPVIGPPLDTGGIGESMERDPSLPFSRSARDDLIQDGGEEDENKAHLIAGETEFERTMRKRAKFRMGVAGERHISFFF